MIGFLVKILLFALGFTFLLSWGYVKQQRQMEEMLEKLLKKSRRRVRKAFQEKETLTRKDIEALVQTTSVSLFWSKKKLQVTDPSKLANQILTEMKESGELTLLLRKGFNEYQLTKGA